MARRRRGDLLPDDPFESWAQDVRDRLRMLYLDVLRLAGRREVLPVVDPADERAHLELIAALARRGDRRAAAAGRRPVPGDAPGCPVADRLSGTILRRARLPLV